MSGTRELVAEAIGATRIHTSTRYSWFGRMSPRLPTRVVTALTPRTARDYLTHTLAGQLYGDFYLRGRAEPARWDVGGSMQSRSAFEATLSAANRGCGYRDGEWRVLAIDQSHAVVAKDGLELTVSRSELVDVQVGDAVIGTAVALQMPNELLRIAPGFYTACGNLPLNTNAQTPLVRLYWHLRPAGAAPFVAAATRRLNAAHIPFRLKVLNDPNTYSRCDAGVIYLHGSLALTDLAHAVHDELSHHLRPNTPVFTEQLAPGLGVAQDPGTTESFGQHRCRMLADGLVQAHEDGRDGADDKMDMVVARFARDGVNLDAPHRSSLVTVGREAAG